MICWFKARTEPHRVCKRDQLAHFLQAGSLDDRRALRPGDRQMPVCAVDNAEGACAKILVRLDSRRLSLAFAKNYAESVMRS
eukprot:s107_g26.t1